MSKTYSNAIEEIKSRCNIVDVISSVVPLKRAGSNYKGVCPFHNEKTPSFVVSETKQIFTCFGCGATGDVIEFVKRYYNIGFQEAIEKLAQQYGIELESLYENQGPDKGPYYEINKIAARYFFDSIKKPGNEGLKYMQGRGFKNETIQKFGIGWADADWDTLLKHLHSNKITNEQALELSLVSKNDKGRVYDRFRSRVVFPIINTKGQIIGFGGRIVGEGDPKYLNSSESLIFQKKYNLFGLNLSKKAIQDDGYAIVVEGYMDVASLYQAGVENVCASCGTALTTEQAKLLKRYTNKVVLCYDADSAGINAALRGIDILRDAGLDVKVLHVDEGKDPDEYVRKHSADDFKNLIKEKALSDIDYKVCLIKKKYDINDTSQGVKFLQAVASVLRKLSPVEADLYIKKISRAEKISEGALRREVNQEVPEVKATEQASDKSDIEPEVEISQSQLLLEKTLIKLSLMHSEYFDKLKDYGDSFISEAARSTYAVLDKMYAPEKEFDLDAFKDQLNNECLKYVNELIDEIHIGSNDKKAFDDCIFKLDKQRKDKRKKEIQDILDLADADTNPELIEKLMVEYMTLQK